MANKHHNQTIGFADRLNQVMYDKNMNASQLAKLIEMERKTVYSWQWGYTMPNSLILARICKVLGVSADYLLFGSGGAEMKIFLSQRKNLFVFPQRMVLLG